MSSFLKRGKRIKARADKKVVKKSTKEFYKILGELDRVAEILKQDKELTDENLVEKAQELTEIKIDRMERFVLKGKLGLYEEIEKEVTDGKTDDK